MSLLCLPQEQCLARQRIGFSAVGNDCHTIDKHPLGSTGILIRIVEGILGEPRAKRDPRKAFEVLFTNPDPDPTSYGRGISELLRLMNSGEFEGGRKALVNRIMQKARGPAKVVEELYLTVLARRPRVEENRRMLEFLNKHGAEAATYEQILWVLLNSSEFTLNH